jgi:hypothetical protein
MIEVFAEAGLPDFSRFNIGTINGKNVPNGPKIYQMAIKHTNIFCKTLPILPKLGFLV